MHVSKLIVAILFLSACIQRTEGDIDEQVGMRTWNVRLENDLGEFLIVLPRHFDTVFSWTRYSDCGDPCASTNYRIQSKKLPVYKETGFYFPPADSAEQFTISHPKQPRPWPIPDSSLVRQAAGKLKAESFENHSGQITLDTIIHVNARDIAVAAFETYDTTRRSHVQILKALTSVKGNLLELVFERRRNFADTGAGCFILTSFEALKTIRIND